MMLSRWVSLGQGRVALVIHPYPTPWDDPTPYSVWTRVIQSFCPFGGLYKFLQNAHCDFLRN